MVDGSYHNPESGWTQYDVFGDVCERYGYPEGSVPSVAPPPSERDVREGRADSYAAGGWPLPSAPLEWYTQARARAIEALHEINKKNK